MIKQTVISKKIDQGVPYGKKSAASAYIPPTAAARLTRSTEKLILIIFAVI
jgi:hypothetical protein